MTRGIFITFEGGEGAGKSTQIRRLAERLRAGDREVVLTREPGGSPGAESIRELLLNGETDRWSPLTEALLMNAARRDHIERVIAPALARGAVVLCDRFADSTRAYQGAGGEVDRAVIAQLEAAVVGEVRPDLTLIFDLPVESGLTRALARNGGEERFEAKGAAFHERLRAAYLDIAEAEPERCVVIDATASLDAVETAIAAAVQPRLDHRHG
ncbi:MAG: dTMP kinase [Caulobacter sp.]|nr:dTMP kinase [Caulobacter sp.]